MHVSTRVVHAFYYTTRTYTRSCKHVVGTLLIFEHTVVKMCNLNTPDARSCYTYDYHAFAKHVKTSPPPPPPPKKKKNVDEIVWMKLLADWVLL